MKCPHCGFDNDDFLGKCESCGGTIQRSLESEYPQNPRSDAAPDADSAPKEEKPAATTGDATSSRGSVKHKPAYRASAGMNQYALISVILGGVGFVFSVVGIVCCLGWTALPLNIGAIMLGFMASKQIREQKIPGQSRSMAVAGILLGLAGLAFRILSIVIALILILRK